MLEHASQLTEASKEFLERFGAVIQPHVHSEAPTLDPDEISGAMRIFSAGLKRLDPDCDYFTWFRACAIIFNESHASGEGYRLFDSWSATGAKYKGMRDTKATWKSCRLGHSRPLRMGSFQYMLKAQGHDWREVCAEAEYEEFEHINNENTK